MSIRLVLMMVAFMGAFVLLQAFKCGEEPAEFEPKPDASAGTLHCCEELKECMEALDNAQNGVVIYKEIAENCVDEKVKVRRK